MFLVPRDIELSRRRAPQREAVLLYLWVAREASLGEVSEATGVRPARVVGIMEGAVQEYAADLSLCGLGAARCFERAGARWYGITSRGDAAAREVAQRLGLAAS